tara:strand:- start:60 stop:476 length:417 start_codon:yes stop_codon:yes gene_type:complete
MATNTHKKDLLNLAEAYGTMLAGGAHLMAAPGIAQQAAEQLRDEDGEDHDKTGGMSDEALLHSVEKKGTAGDALLRAAHERIRQGESLTPHERDALARDQYGYHGEDNEDTDTADQAEFAKIDPEETQKAQQQGFKPA